MSLMTIVAREQFISIVTESTSQNFEDRVTFLELIPDTVFIALSGDKEYADMVVEAAKTLVQQGSPIEDIANSLLIFLSDLPYDPGRNRNIDVILAGFSISGQAQYHILSNSKKLESYFPGKGECLYYANDFKAMHELERLLKINGISSISQVQAAQTQLHDNTNLQKRHYVSIFQKAN